MLYLYNLLYLLIPIILLFIILSINIYAKQKKKKLDNYFVKCKNESNSLTNQIYTNELRSLSLIKNKNNNAVLIENAATMVYEIETLKKNNLKLSIEGAARTNKYQILTSNKLFLKIRKNEHEIKKLSSHFFEIVGPVLRNIKVIRNEVIIYKNGLREFFINFENNTPRKNSPKSNDLVHNELEKIRNELGILDNFINSNELENAIDNFNNIKIRFLVLIKFANCCELLEKMIFFQIPKYVSKLKILFSNAKLNTSCDFTFLSFDTQIISLNEDITRLMYLFTIHSIEEAKILSKKVLEALKNLDDEINREIDSFNFINKHKKEIIKYRNDITKLYLLLKSKVKIAYEIDKIYFSQFGKDMSNLEEYLNESSSLIEKIENDESNSNISFSSKKFKYKSFYYQVKGFYLLYVELKRKIELFYLEGESNLLKFDRLSILLRSINYYIKNDNLILDLQEIENLKEIEKIKQKIITIILNTPEKVAPIITNEYKKMLMLMSKCMKTIGLKIEISKIFKQIVKLLAPKRSSDLKLNEFIILSENNYLDGDYNIALSNIINSLSKGVN